MANVDKIYQLINTLELYESQVYMGAWLKPEHDYGWWNVKIEPEDPMCGFVACAGGWTLINEGFVPMFDKSVGGFGFFERGNERLGANHEDVGNVAADILGIDKPNGGGHLFTETKWKVPEVVTCLKYLAEDYEMYEAMDRTREDHNLPFDEEDEW